MNGRPGSGSARQGRDQAPTVTWRDAHRILLTLSTALCGLQGVAVSERPAHAAPGHSVVVVRPPPTAVAAVHAYVAAFTRGRYPAMWSLLTPGARDGWGGLGGYATFYRAKFAPVRLLGVSYGAASDAGAAVHVPITLDLAWRASGPPAVLSLFHNLETTAVRSAHHWCVAQGGPLDSSAPLIPPPRPPARTARVHILMYHHVSNLPPPAPSQVSLTVTGAAFAAQLSYLATHGYHTILLSDLFNYLYYGRPLPPRPVILTFDDGYLDNWTDAFPLLRRHHMVAEFNIITAYPGITLGVNRYMTWPQIAAMAAAGMEIESHTIDHQNLGLMDSAHAAYELRFSRAILAWHIHRAVQFLAYPSGEPFRTGTPAAQARILALLARFGYIGALLDPVTPGALQDARSPYQLPRVRVANTTTLAAFAAGLNT